MSDERRLLTAGRKALLDAADYIDKHGHAVGSYRICDHPEKMPRVCALGGLRMATDDQAALGEAVRLLEMAIASQHIAVWNDASSKAHVVAVLRRAALSAGKA